ncbi:MAG: protein kinase [Planctomycetota bacterium]
MERIGPYQVVAQLGRGGMGAVLRARDVRSGREVALKVLLAQRGQSEHARRRTATELSALARLEHPHVVRVLDAGEHAGAPWLALELVDGESLEERLRRQGALPVDEALRLGRELADALAHVHERGVLHRDLKPDNVLLERGRGAAELERHDASGVAERSSASAPANVLLRRADGAALLTDFGLALDLEADYSRLSRTGVFMGTPGYWAPEQARGEIHAFTPATDVYGLGAVLYAALTGGPPVQATTLMEHLELERFERVVPPHRARPEVPAWLSAVVVRCLRPAPSARFASAAELAAALERGERDPPRRGLALVLGALALGAALGAALLLRADRPSPSVASGAPAPAPSVASSAPATSSSTPTEQPEGELLFRAARDAYQAGRRTESVDLLRRAVALGHLGAATNLGALLASGDGVPRDEVEAARLLRLAAEGGATEGMYRLGRLLAQGGGRLPQDPTEARRWQRRAAEAGHLSAMVMLGLMLARGQGGAQDEPQAVEWYRRAAERGSTLGMVNLAGALGRGAGVARDLDQAIGWSRRAAEQGVPEGMHNLAVELEQRGAPADLAEAPGWYRRAAERGNADAMFNLALLRSQGREGLPRDDALAVEWYRRAGERGKVEAMVNLGVALESGRGVARDPLEAARWYRAAAERGSASAMSNLGMLLTTGDGVPRDDAQAVEWFRRAAQGGYPQGMFNLAVMLAQGRGVARDDAQAVQWYGRAAAAGHLEAMNNLGAMHLLGQGTPQDDAEGARWLRRAAEAGHRESMCSLGIFHLQGTNGFAKDEALAAGWFRRSAERGVPRAMLDLGTLLLEGRGVAKDPVEAEAWLRQAAAQSSDPQTRERANAALAAARRHE